MRLMRISKRGLDLIKQFEGLRLESYKCPAGVLTVGYGHIKGVKPNMVIDEMRAEEYLIEDIAPIEKELNKLGINFRQDAYDSICSWIFNLGIGNFNSSTLKKKIVTNASDEEITDQLIKWVNANKKPLVGLKKRRIAEANMFLGYERYYLDKDNNIKKK